MAGEAQAGKEAFAHSRQAACSAWLSAQLVGQTEEGGYRQQLTRWVPDSMSRVLPTCDAAASVPRRSWQGTLAVHELLAALPTLQGHLPHTPLALPPANPRQISQQPTRQPGSPHSTLPPDSRTRGRQ